MQLSKKGEDLLKAIEKLSLQPYDDQKGIKSTPITNWVKGATIGYGYLIPESEWETYKSGITQTQADQLYKEKIKPYINTVEQAVKVSLTSNQVDALIILCYNIGISGFKGSSVVKMVNGQPTQYRDLESAWKSWNKSQGKVNQGLINRRNAEWNIYTRSVYSQW